MVDVITKPGEDEAVLLRDEYNRMNVVISADGRSLVALGQDRKGLDVAQMTPMQKKAFERENEAYVAAQRRRVELATAAAIRRNSA